MKQRTTHLTLAGLGLLCSVPVWAVSLSTIGPAQPMPQSVTPADFNSTELVGADVGAGSTTLVPLMAADTQAHPVAVETVDAPANGGGPAGSCETEEPSASTGG